MSDLKNIGPGPTGEFESQEAHLDLRSPETIEQEKQEVAAGQNSSQLTQEQELAQIPDLDSVASTPLQVSTKSTSTQEQVEPDMIDQSLDIDLAISQDQSLSGADKLEARIFPAEKDTSA